jgi:hypothetical protein
MIPRLGILQLSEVSAKKLGDPMKLGVIGLLILSVLIAGVGCGQEDGCNAGLCDPCTRHEDCCVGRCAPFYKDNAITPETYLGDFCTDDDPETACPTVLPPVDPPTNGPTIQFAWDPNMEVDLAGYWLYQSERSGQYERSNRVLEVPAGTETCTLEALPPGTYFWVLTAFDRALNESGFSNEVSAVIE